MFDEEKIRQRIEDVALREMEISPLVAKDVAFHMTDWLDDLSALVEFYKEPEARSDSEIEGVLVDFLTHAPNHLAAAGKLFVDSPVSDVFGSEPPMRIDSHITRPWNRPPSAAAHGPSRYADLFPAGLRSVV